MKQFGPDFPVTFTLDLDGEPLYGTMARPDGLTAATWAARDEWLSFFPGALEPEQEGFWLDQLADPLGPVTDSLVRDIAYGLAEEVYGVKWWAAHRLCASAAANWVHFTSWCVRHRFRPADESADRIVAACWSWRLEVLDPEDKNAGIALEAEIFGAPAGYSEAVDHSARFAANRAMFAGLGGVVPS